MPRIDPPVIIIGGGGHAKLLIETLRLAGRRVLFVTDDKPKAQGTTLVGYDVKGPQDLVMDHKPEDVDLVNAIGSVSPPNARAQVYQRFVGRGYRFASVIHPSATISPGVDLAAGVQVMAGAIIQKHSVIGANVIINTRASVDHDCAIGAHCHIAPGATLCGAVTLGQTCHVGAGATIIQRVRVGYHAMIAAGAVVTENLPNHAEARGVPARA